MVLMIVQFVQLAIKAAPEVKQVYEDGRALIESMFKGGLVSKEEQDRLMKWADEHMAATLAGVTPPELNVE